MSGLDWEIQHSRLDGRKGKDGAGQAVAGSATTAGTTAGFFTETEKREIFLA